MIDILYNKLGASNDASVAEWKDICPDIFNRHSQHSQHSQHNIKDTIINKDDQIEEVIPVSIPVQTHRSVCDTLSQHSQHSQPQIVAKKRKECKDTKDTNKPLNIIISETMSFNNSTEYIKEALITMISKDEFTKVFGLTKCAEIMSGVVNNRWNKSTALFISFLLDKEVYYNDKAVIYNKEKNSGRITITKT